MMMNEEEYKPPKKPILISVKIIIVLTTIVSTGVSLAAGVMLYIESLETLFDTVDEVSLSLTTAAKKRFSETFKESEAQAMSIDLLFRQYEGFNHSGPQGAVELFRATQFSYLKARPDTYSVAFRCWKRRSPNESQPWERPDGFFRGGIWSDILLLKNGTKKREWTYALSYEGFAPSNEINTTFLGNDHLAVALNLDEHTGKYSDVGVVDAYAENLKLVINHNSQKRGWHGTYFWYASDGTPYNYMTFDLPMGGELSAFPGYGLLTVAYMKFDPWMRYLGEMKYENSQMVIANSFTKLVYAHTLFDMNAVAVKSGCSSRCANCDASESGACSFLYTELGPTVTSAFARSVPRKGEFFRSSIPGTKMNYEMHFGEYFLDSDVNKTNRLYKVNKNYPVYLESGEYFLRMVELFQYAEEAEDEKGKHTIDLLWLRPVSTVQEKVYSALVRLIIFCLLIFVFDFFIAVVEYWMIARPLFDLSISIRLLETMETSECEVKLRNATDSTVVAINEVYNLQRGLLFMTRCLTEYRSYLPGSLFAEHTPAPPKPELNPLAPGLASFDRTSTDSAVQEKQETVSSFDTVSSSSLSFKNSLLAVSLSICQRATFMRVNLQFELGIGNYMHFGEVISKLEQITSETNGVFHGFSIDEPSVINLSWGAAAHCTDCVTQAARAANMTSSLSIASGCGIECGKIVAGNVGSRTKRGFVALGAVVSNLLPITSLSDTYTKLSGNLTVVVSELVATSCVGAFNVAAVGMLKLKDSHVSIVYQLGRRVDAETGGTEWMYHLDNVSDPLAPLFKDWIDGKRIDSNHLVEDKLSVVQRQALRNLTDNPNAFVKQWVPAAFTEATPDEDAVIPIRDNIANGEDEKTN
eukprot:TRINITY_DN10811_c0_g1_i1.p1 TRINITY_DN10811_c0_g1~~TRINITY_DN10811_c0_g1_i1.p1  ORF type:complete len:887 (+),score=177.01 TRINITY_DN10811_c0_g1_i1:63-2663(+)